MNLIKQDGPYCLVASAAMILDASITELHLEIGQDGTNVWWPPAWLRGIHIQEIQDCCLRRKKCLYNIELHPHLCPRDDFDPRAIFAPTYAQQRFYIHLSGMRAILITDRHACAWDGERVYDPNGYIRNYCDYKFNEAWVLTIKS